MLHALPRTCSRLIVAPPQSALAPSNPSVPSVFRYFERALGAGLLRLAPARADTDPRRDLWPLKKSVRKAKFGSTAHAVCKL